MTAALWRRALRHPPHQLPRRLALYLSWQAGKARRRRAFASGRLRVGPAALAKAVRPHSVEAVVAAIGRRPLGATHLDGPRRERFVAELQGRFPDACARIVGAADEVCRHRFDLLGSGPVDLGPTIDWSVDFKTGFRWPVGFSPDLAPIELSNDADVKIPWELSRCHHFVTLGQAYWLTGDERYAREFVSQLRAWIAANPVMGSINWYNAMEAAIRIVNWLWAASLFSGSPSFGPPERTLWLASALEHGRFILENLETDPFNPSTNHYIADLAGLTYLGVLLPQLAEARHWRETGVSELVRELSSQVHEDGVDQECSLGYHRLVTEIVASCFAVCRQNDIAIPPAHWDRLGRMFEFALSYIRPDGGAPIVGDTDDGRLHMLSPGSPCDHRHLLAFGGWLLDRPDLASAAGPHAMEAAWWSGEPGRTTDTGITAEAQSRAFGDGGFYVLRTRDRYLLAVCCDPRGPTGHAHNDTLGFELAALGRAWIVDSGSYVYTASAEWRHAFRSAAAHNVVRVDGVELNRIEVHDLSRRGREAVPRVQRWESDAGHDLLEVEHAGYASLGVRHRRRFYLDKRAGFWLIEDALTGTGVHDVESYLHFDHGITVARSGPATFLANDPPVSFEVAVDGLPETAEIALDEGWISRRYGHKETAPLLTLRMRHPLPLLWTWRLAPRRSTDAEAPATFAIPVR
jgi:hypothetical protein